MARPTARWIRLLLPVATFLAVIGCSQAPNPPNNHAPVIDAFAPAVNPTVMGNATTLHWMVHDADGDTLTCTLDPADGTPVLTVNACTNATNRTHTYASTGTYTPTLTVTDGNGGSANANSSVDIENPAPGNANPTVQDFEADPNPVFTNDATTFSWTVSDPDGDDVSCELDPDDGQASIDIADCRSTSSQAYTYTAAGDYEPTLTANDGHGGVTITTIGVKVEDNAAPSIATFTAAPNPGYEDEATTFSWSVSDPDDDPLSCTLDPGDGNSPIDIADCKSVTTTDYTYTTAGTYPATLTATDDHGNAATRDVTVTVEQIPPPGISGFKYSPKPTLIDRTTTFSWQVAGDGPIACAINFGDTGSSTTVLGDCRSVTSIGHTYRLDGDYDATLTATDSRGGVATSTLSVDVNFSYSGTWQGSISPGTGPSYPFTAHIKEIIGDLSGTWSSQLDWEGTLTGTGTNIDAKLAFRFTTPVALRFCTVKWVATRTGRTLRGSYDTSSGCPYGPGKMILTKGP